MPRFAQPFALSVALLAIVATSTIAESPAEPFNGKNLDGWTPKIRYQNLGDDPANTFRVEDGSLVVRYDAKAYPDYRKRYYQIIGEEVPKEGDQP